MQITFLGATETVTGSKYLITTEKQKILIDCGLFQGLKQLRQRNWDKFPIDPATINAVVLTHAHIDHSGYLPLLIKNGFTGKIYCSPATFDLCSILLPDSGYLQEEEAKFANKHGFSKHKPALPLYTKEDAEKALLQFQVIDFNIPLKFVDDLTITLKHAGHILGAAVVYLKQHDTTLVFSGDLGRLNDSFMKAPESIHKLDYLVLESTYGDRLHEKSNTLDTIEAIINRTIKRGGSIIIPAFAVGRAQMMLYFIYLLKQAGKIPNIPVYLDSPMAINATELLCKYAEEHKIPKGVCKEVCDMATYIHTPEESKALNAQSSPIIIISASGMLEGGRILHHIKYFGSDPRNTILLTGYQAAGTRGEALANGKKTLKIHGEIHTINAEVVALNNLSAHADYKETIQWLSQLKEAPRKIFLTHGELSSAQALQKRIKDELGWNCVIPKYLQKENLS